MEPRTSHGYHPGPLPQLRPVLIEWIRLQTKYCRAWDWKDATWLYNERAALGVLAAAVWKSGGTALEEYSSDKFRRSPGTARRRRYTGRCDLNFSIGGHDFVVEAKLAWPRLRLASTGRRIERALADATKAARDADTYAGARRLAVVLAGPSLPTARREDLQAVVRAFVDQLRCRRGCARAWYFPLEARNAFEINHRVWPGTAILLKPLRAQRPAG